MKSYSELLNRKNVVGAGVGLKQVQGRTTQDVAVVILVSEKVPPEKLKPEDLIPKTIDGRVTDVIEVGEIKLLQQDDDGLNWRKQYVRPAMPGISIGHYKITAGTFGAVVWDQRTGEPLILSNNHVLANTTNGNDGRAKVGDAILQPGKHDGGQVDHHTLATLHRFIPIHQENESVTCPLMRWLERVLNWITKLRGRKYTLKLVKQEARGNLVDAALAKPLYLDSIYHEILGIGPVRGMTRSYLAQPLQKSGRTTGVTSGRVLVLDASVWVNMGASQALFEDQIITSNMSQGGDSGSLVLDHHNNAVGLLFAGSDQVTILNKIHNVASLLHVDLC